LIEHYARAGASIVTSGDALIAANVEIGLIGPVSPITNGGLALPDRNASTEPVYTRRQAIRDGQLIDVTDLARAVMLDASGIPVVLTNTVWRRIHATGGRVPEHANRERVLRILEGARAAVVSHLHVLGRTPFTVRLGRRATPLVVEFHESDEGQVVATITLDQQAARR
jgi:hypothetical protein